MNMPQRLQLQRNLSHDEEGNGGAEVWTVLGRQGFICSNVSSYPDDDDDDNEDHDDNDDDDDEEEEEEAITVGPNNRRKYSQAPREIA